MNNSVDPGVNNFTFECWVIFQNFLSSAVIFKLD